MKNSKLCSLRLGVKCTEQVLHDNGFQFMSNPPKSIRLTSTEVAYTQDFPYHAGYTLVILDIASEIITDIILHRMEIRPGRLTES